MAEDHPSGISIGNRSPKPFFEGLFIDDRYQVMGVISEGTFGRIYLALHTHLGYNVAIKELSASRITTDHAMDEHRLERFKREARATGMIQQPNVVTVYDLFLSPAGNHYMVMEYVDGTNLRELLAQVGTLPVARAIAIATDIARALEAVHERDVVHRDIKPANIMITRRGAAKLMDFGIAQVGHESHRTQITTGHPGTPLYMSPEQASSAAYLDGRSDLYSLGLVLYEMLAGAPYARHPQSLGTQRSDLPPQVVAIVDRSLARDRDARFQCAADFLEGLKALAELPDSPNGSHSLAPPPYVPEPAYSTALSYPPTPPDPPHGTTSPPIYVPAPSYFNAPGAVPTVEPVDERTVFAPRYEPAPNYAPPPGSAPAPTSAPAALLRRAVAAVAAALVLIVGVAIRAWVRQSLSKSRSALPPPVVVAEPVAVSDGDAHIPSAAAPLNDLDVLSDAPPPATASLSGSTGPYIPPAPPPIYTPAPSYVPPPPASLPPFDAFLRYVLVAIVAVLIVIMVLLTWLTVYTVR